MNQMILSGNNELTMSSREIAELCEKEHKNVMADIRHMLDELGETSAKFSADLPDGVANGVVDMANQVLIKQSLDYCPLSGVFTWKKKRPDHHFSSNRAQSTWHARYAGKVAGCVNAVGYIDITISRQGVREHVLAHRAAHVIMLGRFPIEDVDHKNGCRSDNRWENLREVSRVINQRNKRISGSNTSGYTGVSFSKITGLWHAYINTEPHVRKSLGYFKTKDAAVAERNRFILENPSLGYTQRHGTVKAYHADVWRAAYALQIES